MPQWRITHCRCNSASPCRAPPSNLHSGHPFVVQYCGERDIHYVMDLVDNELSEPYSIFTYRRACNICLKRRMSSVNENEPAT